MQSDSRVSRSPLRLLEAEATPFLRNRATITVLSLATLVVLAWLDRLGMGQFSMTTLYLIPIAVVAWYVGRDWGRLAAVFAGFVQTIAHLTSGGSALPALTLWNSVMIVALSVVVGEVLVRLHVALDRERDLARTDNLTGLPNARSFDEAASAEIERMRRYGRGFTVVCMDLDHFKAVNDTLGHHAGDRLIRDVARALRENLRRVDIVARIGGDEFAMLLPETDESQAQVALSHIRIALRELTGAYGTEVQASMGAVSYSDTPDSVAEMLRAADTAMYAAKSAGRDRVESLTLAPAEAIA